MGRDADEDGDSNPLFPDKPRAMYSAFYHLGEIKGVSDSLDTHQPSNRGNLASKVWRVGRRQISRQEGHIR